MHQNAAEYTGAYFEGSLIDNFILTCKRGYCAVYEKFVNPNMSEHIYKFVPYTDKTNCDKLWAEFYDRELATEQFYAQR